MSTPELTDKDRFDTWLKELDEICFDEFGFSYQDLPDQPYKEWFNDGYSAEDAFYELAENSYAGVEFENVQAFIRSIYTQEFDTYTDADSGL